MDARGGLSKVKEIGGRGKYIVGTEDARKEGKTRENENLAPLEQAMNKSNGTNALVNIFLLAMKRFCYYYLGYSFPTQPDRGI
jgi:hypothetical protein